jgi:hypothetical protein
MLKLFEIFREFLLGLGGLFVFWPDARALMRRTVGWCRHHDLAEAWIAYWVVLAVLLWASNLLFIAVTAGVAGDDAPRLIAEAATLTEAQRHLPAGLSLGEKLAIQRQVMFHQGHLLSLTPMQQIIVAALQALAAAALVAAMMGCFIRLLPRLRRPKKQAQVWAFTVAFMPLANLPLLFGLFGALVLLAVWPLPVLILGAGSIASLALLSWGVWIGQRAFRLSGRRYWGAVAASLMLIGSFMLVGGFAPKPYADLARTILGAATPEKVK